MQSFGHHTYNLETNNATTITCHSSIQTIHKMGTINNLGLLFTMCQWHTLAKNAT
jgi:hypothetical protein